MKFEIKRPDGTFIAPRGIRSIKRILKRRMANHPAGTTYKIKRNEGDTFSHPRKRRETLQRLVHVLQNADPGDVIRVKAVQVDVVFVIRATEFPRRAKAPDGAHGFWHPDIVDAYELTFGKFSGIGFGGAYNCRKMRNSSSWSMHSNWPPVLAIDFMCPPSTQDKIEAFLKNHLPDDMVYVSHRDNALHNDHIHVQKGPNRSGTPACA